MWCGVCVPEHEHGGSDRPDICQLPAELCGVRNVVIVSVSDCVCIDMLIIINDSAVVGLSLSPSISHLLALPLTQAPLLQYYYQ